MNVLIILLLIVAFVAVGFGFSILRSLGSWNRTYTRLGKRYAGKQSSGGVFYGYLLSNPGLSFDYGRTFVTVRNRKSLKPQEGKHTIVSMQWPDRKIRLDISTTGMRSRMGSNMKQVEMDDPEFQHQFSVASNNPVKAKRMLNRQVQWQLEQLRRHGSVPAVTVSIHRGQLSVCKPTYLKEYQQLDDLIRFSLELFDQMMLVDAEGIQFVREDEASIVADVKCPICSEEINQDMVVCKRCKTPHCLDCWDYNGQCATFACSETRYEKIGSINV